jgi:hypothetical protein
VLSVGLALDNRDGLDGFEMQMHAVQALMKAVSVMENRIQDPVEGLCST